MYHLILIVLTTVADVIRMPIKGKVLIKGISNKESSEGLSLDKW